MTQPIKIYKFGGASIKDAQAIRNVAEILQSHRGEPLLIVVSAMGKTTNGLEKIVQSHSQRTGQAYEHLETVKTNHFTVMRELFPANHDIFAQINDTFVEIEWVLEEEPHDNYDYMYDQIVSIGELASSKIVAAFLNTLDIKSHWLDARDVIRTDNLYREGWVIWDETIPRARQHALPKLEAGDFVLTQGFIGSTSENFTTTLGREGSDYSAAIFSHCLDAKSMTIWKDVPGVLTADPRLFENVTKLDRLSYKEAIEMTYYGAKVIHPKTIKPLQNKSIPLYVKSFINPEGSGTYISTEVEDNYPPMIAVEQNQATLQISTRDFSFVAEHHLSELFQLMAESRLQVNMMQNNAISFVVCVNDIDDRVDKFAAQIQERFKVIVDRNLELITVRHYREEMLDNLRRGKIILLEERLRKTIQMVLKNIPMMIRKED